MNILEYIPKGRENAISRQELARITGLNSRLVRTKINELRTDQEHPRPIMSSSRTKGYWLSDEPEEIKQFKRESESRKRAEDVVSEACDRMLEQMQNERLEGAEPKGDMI